MPEQHATPTSANPAPAPRSAAPADAQYDADDSIDLLALAATLWQSRRQILMIAGVTAAFGLIAGAAQIKREALGFFRLQAPALSKAATAQSSLSIAGLTQSDHKVLSSVLAEPGSIERYIRAKSLDGTPTAGLLRSLQSAEVVRERIAPVFAFTKTDAKEIVQADSNVPAGTLLGLSLSASSRDGETAEKLVRDLAEYVTDVAFYRALVEHISLRDSELRRSTMEFDNQLIDLKYRQRRAEERMRSLRAVSQRNPEAMRGDGRTVMSVSDTTTRFLPLPTQLVAADVDAVDLAASIEKLDRDRAQTDFLAAYYAALKAALGKAATAIDILNAMPAAKATAEQGRNIKASDALTSAANSMQLQHELLKDAFALRSGFINEPVAKPFSLRRAAMGLLLGGMLGTFAALLWVLLANWYRERGASVFQSTTKTPL